MPRHLVAAALLMSSLISVAHAEDRYIDDTLIVPLRRGAGLEYRIVHQGVSSGTTVTLVEQDSEQGWTQVRTADGTEGWLPSRYLSREPIARQKMAEALRVLGQPDDGSVSLLTAIDEEHKQLESLRAERDTLLEQLTELRRVSGNATELDVNNRQLSEQLQMLKNDIGVLRADNQRLRDTAWQKWFINGVWATGVGGFLTLLLSRLATRRRRQSEWV